MDNSGQVTKEIFDFKGKVVSDFYASYKINKNVSWTFGIDNLFNVHPDLAIVPGSANPYNGSSSFGDSESGGPFEAVQMGFNGMRMFTKLAFNF